MPAMRMKAKREHQVSLCGRAVEVLDAAHTLGDGSWLVFPMRAAHRWLRRRFPKMLRYHEVVAVPCGFRSSFRDWADETDHPREVIEAALAYVVQKKVEAAPAGRSCPGTGCVHRTRRRDLDEPPGDECDDQHLICCRQDVKQGVPP